MIKTIIGYLPSIVIPTIISLITTVIYGNYMEPESYGEYNIFLTTVSIVNTLLFSFMSSSVLRFYNSFENNHQQFKVVSTYVLTTLGLLLILNVFIFPFKGFEGVFLVCCIGFIGIINLFTNILRASENIKWFNIIKSLIPLCTLFIVLYYVFYGTLNTKNAILSMYIPMGFLSFIMALVFLKQGLIRFNSEAYEKKIFKDSIKYGMPLAFSGLLYLVLSSSNRYLISYFLGNTQVGIYSFAYRIAELSLVNVTMIIILATHTQLVKEYDQFGKQRAEKLLNKYLSLHFIIIIPVVILMTFYVDEFMNVIFPVYSEGAIIVKFTIIGTMFFTISAYTDKAFQLTKNTRVILKILLICGLLNILLNLILIPKIGIEGAIIATIFTYVVYVWLSVKLSEKYIKIVFPFKTIFYLLVVNILISLLIFVIDKNLLINNISRSILGITIYIILYSLSIYFLYKNKRI
ncbi:oligosaccharide flippase family protein [Peribacillus simplex]|uniref:lipopolysaccharide biosynthesis protein n=1 Tax=Peribacillus simplex TaxID=1478 RepID=UPI003265DD01